MNKYDKLEIAKKHLRCKLKIPEYVRIDTVIQHLSVAQTGGGWVRQESRYYYIIFIHIRFNLKDQVDTLAHEMKHVQQFWTGRLNMDENGEWWWLGKKINFRKYEKDWSKLPHEKEAVRFEHSKSEELLNLVKGAPKPPKRKV